MEQKWLVLTKEFGKTTPGNKLIDLTPFQSGGMSLDRVVLFFDQGMVNWDTYYIDDIGLSSAPVSTSELDVNYSLSIYPNPLANSSVISFSIDQPSFVKWSSLIYKGK